MTVSEQVEQHKANASSSTKQKINTVWLCPNVVNNITLNNNIRNVYRVPMNGQLPEEIEDREAIKHWYEDGMLCIIYKNN